MFLRLFEIFFFGVAMDWPFPLVQFFARACDPYESL